MFKNLKEKVKNGSSSDQFSIVHTTPVKQHNQTSRSKSTASNTDDTKSNASSKITNDDNQSTGELENDMAKSPTQTASDSKKDYEFKNTPAITESVSNEDTNEHVLEKIKFQKFNESLLSKIERLNVRNLYCLLI